MRAAQRRPSASGWRCGDRCGSVQLLEHLLLQDARAIAEFGRLAEQYPHRCDELARPTRLDERRVGARAELRAPGDGFARITGDEDNRRAARRRVGAQELTQIHSGDAREPRFRDDEVGRPADRLGKRLAPVGGFFRIARGAAKQLGVHPTRLRIAVDNQRHQPVIERRN